MQRIVLAAAMVVPLLAGQLSAPVHADIDDQDQIFIAALASNGGVHYDSPYQAISVANTYVCGGLDKGESLRTVISDVAAETNLPESGSEFFVGAAVETYCPQYVSLIPAPASSANQQPATADLVTRFDVPTRTVGSRLS